MAERRMFAKTIIDSDAFLNMPASAQLLYFHLSMRADDDGFVNNPKSIMRMIGCVEDDAKLLFVKKFLIPFDNGVVVIKHWKIHNYIRKDTYTQTKYKEELAALELDENNAYRLACDTPLQLRDECVTSPSTQDRIGKDRLGKGSIGKDIGGISPETPPTPPKPKKKEEKPVFKKYGENGWVQLTDEQYKRLVADLGEAEAKRCITHIDESAQITGNKNKWKDWNLVVRRCHREGWGLKQGFAEKKAKYPKPSMDYSNEADTAAIRELLELDFDEEQKAFRKRLEEIGCG